MDEEQKEIYVDTLSEGVTPFDRFVSRKDIPDMVDLPEVRGAIDNNISRLINVINKDHANRFLPILGNAGTGKTHLYWVLKEKSQQKGSPFYVVYVPAAPAPVRILFHVYTCIMDEVGKEIFAAVRKKIFKSAGGRDIVFGITGLLRMSRRPEDVLNVIRRKKEYSGLQLEVVKALVYSELGNREQKSLALRWILGEFLTEQELEKIGQKYLIEEAPDLCLSALRVLLSLLDKPIILYFDEIEMTYRQFGAEVEVGFLETLKRIYNELHNSLIVTSCLEDIWERIYNLADPPLRSRMERERSLRPFTEEDIIRFYKMAMAYFWDENNLEVPGDPLFPLNEKALKIIYQKTHGVPRLVIKMTKMFIDQILFEGEVAEIKEGELEVPKVRAQMQEEAAAPLEEAPPVDVKKPSKIDKVIADAIAAKEIELEEQEEDMVEISFVSIISSALDSILTFAKEKGDDLHFKFEHKFQSEGKKLKTIGGYVIGPGNVRLGIDMPSIKTLEKPGGVAAFYSVRRLFEALELKAIDKAILITSKGTKGQKYESLIAKMDTLTVIELDTEDAKDLIRNAKKIPSQKGREMARIFYPDIPDLPKEEEES